MSTEIYDTHNLHVTRFTGPADEGEDRARWQVTPTDYSSGYAILDRDELRDLACALLREALA